MPKESVGMAELRSPQDIRLERWAQPLERQSRNDEGIQIQQLSALASPSKGAPLLNLRTLGIIPTESRTGILIVWCIAFREIHFRNLSRSLSSKVAVE